MKDDLTKTVTKTEVITKRERTTVNQFKVDAMKDFLDVVAEEDVDQVFLAIFAKADELGYKLQAKPDALLKIVEKSFG